MRRFPAAPRKEVSLPAVWELFAAPPGEISGPADLAGRASLPAEVPGSVASALVAANERLDGVDLDARDFFFRARFGTPSDVGERRVLRFDGLATVTDAWWNGEHLFHHESVYEPIAREVTLGQANEIVLRFAALNPKKKRGRPRWKTKLVREQQLRWFRTPLLGRMPGWSRGPAPVGPLFGVRLEAPWLDDEDRAELVPTARVVRVEDTRVVCEGSIRARFALRLAGVTSAELVVGDARLPLTVEGDGERTIVHGEASVGEITPWWPHTHGEPFLYDARLEVHGSEPLRLDLGRVGFRALEVSREPDAQGFAIRVNGTSAFCRGASWTTDDLASLRFRANREGHGLFDALAAAKHAGVNMIRVGGTMHYECPDFYARCDELGILVWQDFMFANMDYPVDDEAFAAAVTREAELVVTRLASHPSVAVFSGGSEVQQQAAMVAAPPESWSSRLFEEILPSVVARASHAGYIPGTPYGGPLPFHANHGVTHYYGVGAYLRPVEDARRAEVRFATECLAFANVPDPRTLDRLFPDSAPVVHHPRWKERVPRDHGSGWDFEDVRDHYFKELFGLDPLATRYADHERYLALSRAVPATLVERTFAEWRRAGSTTNGALVWFWKDLELGAGWGALDSSGWPKSVYYAMRRAFAPLTAFFTDEGVNGLYLHVVNDTAWSGEAKVTVRFFRSDGTLVSERPSTQRVAPRSAVKSPVECASPGFADTSYAYRFGPPTYDVAVLSLELPAGAREAGAPEAPSPAFHFPTKLPSHLESALGLHARFEDDRLVVTTERFAQSLLVEVDGFLPLDNHFHLEPGGTRVVALRPLERGARPASGYVTPLNQRTPVKIEKSPG